EGRLYILLSLEMSLDIVFFQAEDGIRHRNVTGVQTCALPISSTSWATLAASAGSSEVNEASWISWISSRTARRRALISLPPIGILATVFEKIGRASCRDRA